MTRCLARHVRTALLLTVACILALPAQGEEAFRADLAPDTELLSFAEQHALAAWQGGRGVANKALVEQHGDRQRLVAVQAGYNNVIESRQYGSNNIAALVQGGVNNVIQLAQSGVGNLASIVQGGHEHLAQVVQNGNYNRVEIMQLGVSMRAFVTQNGNNNATRIIQH